MNQTSSHTEISFVAAGDWHCDCDEWVGDAQAALEHQRGQWQVCPDCHTEIRPDEHDLKENTNV